MKYIYYIALFIIVSTQSAFCMELTITHATDKNPTKPFGIIPLTLATRCGTIKNMFEDIEPKKSLKCTLTDSHFENIVHFVAYLKKIDRLNKLPEKDLTTEEKQFAWVTNEALSWDIKTLTTPEIIALFNNVDHFDVIDRNDNNHLVDEVADRIIKNPDDLASFACLDQKPLFCNVIKKISTKINLEEKFIQPLADSLTERHQLPRTVSIPTCLYHNIRNTITAIPRFFEYPWATKTLFKPCYRNTQTGTMITSFTQQLGTRNTITHLLIMQENTNKRVSVPVENHNLESIISIVANKTESVFICKSKNKTIVINVLDKEKPVVIDQGFKDYAFSDNENELYTIKNREFATLNLENGCCSSPVYFDHPINNILTNQKGTIVLCLDQKEILAGKKIENDNFDFKKLNTEFIPFNTSINNICLHPCKDIICLEICDTSIAIGHVFIDIKTQKTRFNQFPDGLLKPCNLLQFLPETPDILFLGSATEDDFFFNTRTNNFWRKKKNKCNERLIKNEKNINDAYERFTLTADGQHSIEQAIEGNHLIDFIMLILHAGKDGKEGPLDLGVKKITATPLINDSIIEALERFEKGLLPPMILSAAQKSSPMTPELAAQHQRLSPNMQKMVAAADTSGQWKWQWAKNIFYGLTFISAAIIKTMFKVAMDKDKWDKTHGIKKIDGVSEVDKIKANPVVKVVGATAALIIAKIILERATAQY